MPLTFSSVVPDPNKDFVGLAGGEEHSLGLKDDGSLEAWGRDNYGQCDEPTPNTDFEAVAAGYWHSLGLKRWYVAIPYGDMNCNGAFNGGDIDAFFECLGSGGCP